MPIIHGRLQYLVYCLIGNLKFTYYIMLPQNTRTLIIKSAFPAGMSHAGMADIIDKSLPGGGGGGHVKEELKYFGDIKEVKFQEWTNVPGVSTGTCIIRMVHQREISHNIVIDGASPWCLLITINKFTCF